MALAHGWSHRGTADAKVEVLQLGAAHAKPNEQLPAKVHHLEVYGGVRRDFCEAVHSSTSCSLVWHRGWRDSEQGSAELSGLQVACGPVMRTTSVDGLN